MRPRHLQVVKDEEDTREAPVPTTVEGAFRLYSRYVGAIGLRLLGRVEEIDDFVQDVFLAAHRAITRLQRAGAVKAWLATISVRTARRRLRMRRLRRFLGLDDAPEYLDVVDPSLSPEDRALAAAIYRTLDGLPVEQRLAWTLHHIEGETLDRVAILCGCSLATAKRRIARAHQEMRGAWNRG